MEGFFQFIVKLVEICFELIFVFLALCVFLVVILVLNPLSFFVCGKEIITVFLWIYGVCVVVIVLDKFIDIQWLLTPVKSLFLG